MNLPEKQIEENLSGFKPHYGTDYFLIELVLMGLPGE
jgi:hypothetical protein